MNCPEVIPRKVLVFGGRSDFPCELPDDGHKWHERKSPPVVARWRLVERGRVFEYMTVTGDDD